MTPASFINMRTIHIFNPETDLALAADRAFYTPPRKVLEIKNRLTALPALYAEPGDFILLPEDVTDPASLKYYDIACLKNISFVNYIALREISSPVKITPWGWNKAIVNYLVNANVPAYSIPTETDLIKFRDLSHRKISIDFFNKYHSYFPKTIAPRIAFTLPDAIKICKDLGAFCLKSPWSSSGRGITFSHQLNQKLTEQWIIGVIRSQGAIIIEPVYSKIFDFATEWEIDNSNVYFAGHSVFKISGRGKYQYNLILSEEEILSRIKNLLRIDADYIEIQKEFISSHIAPTYSGPLGIDMLITSDGILNPCVEINLRNTMGMAALKVRNNLTLSDEVGNRLRSYFPDNIFIP